MENTQDKLPTEAEVGRKWQEIIDLDKIEKFIIEKFSKDISTVKGFEDSKPRAKFVSKKTNGMFVIKLDSELTFPESKGTIYTNLDRQIELDFDIIQTKEDMLLIKPYLLRLADFDRKSPRLGNLRGKVTATNFLVSKEDIEEKKLFGVTSNVLIQDIHKKLIPLDINSNVVMPKSGEYSEELDLCIQSGKMIYIIDTSRMVSYQDPDVLDVKKEYEEELILEDKVSEFKKKKISSLLIYPIIIPFGPPKPFAFLVSKKDIGGIDPSILELYKKVEDVFLERIMDSNTHTVDVRQNIVNASLQGVALEITDERIRKALKVKPSFTVDLNFKMQQPLRVALEARHIRDCGDYDIVGAEIIGFSGDAEGGRKYNSFLEFVQKI
jgi:hypothetical protein